MARAPSPLDADMDLYRRGMATREMPDEIEWKVVFQNWAKIVFAPKDGTRILLWDEEWRGIDGGNPSGVVEGFWSEADSNWVVVNLTDTHVEYVLACPTHFSRKVSPIEE